MWSEVFKTSVCQTNQSMQCMHLKIKTEILSRKIPLNRACRNRYVDSRCTSTVIIPLGYAVKKSFWRNGSRIFK